MYCAYVKHSSSPVQRMNTYPVRGGTPAALPSPQIIDELYVYNIVIIVWIGLGKLAMLFWLNALLQFSHFVITINYALKSFPYYFSKSFTKVAHNTKYCTIKSILRVMLKHDRCFNLVSHTSIVGNWSSVTSLAAQHLKNVVLIMSIISQL